MLIDEGFEPNPVTVHFRPFARPVLALAALVLWMIGMGALAAISIFGPVLSLAIMFAAGWLLIRVGNARRRLRARRW